MERNRCIRARLRFTWSRLATCLLCWLVTPWLISPAFAHGPNGETHKPVSIGDRDAALSFTSKSISGNGTNRKNKIRIRLYDNEKRQNIKNVVFDVSMYKENDLIFRRFFLGEDGEVDLILDHTDEKRISVSGRKHDIFEGWEMVGDEPIRLSGRIFPESGLYNFKIVILAVDSYMNLLDWQIKFEAQMSIPDNQCYKTPENSPDSICVTSWYEKIESFSYYDDREIITFLMPFNWDKKNIDQIQNIHQEIIIPAEFHAFAANPIYGELNGVALPDFTVMADQESNPENTVVHIMIPQKDLLALTDQAKSFCPGMMVFTVTANTSEAARQAASEASHCPSPPVVLSILRALGLK